MSKSDYEQARVHKMQALEGNAELKKQGRYYMGQIERYKAKNPKAADFPAYEPAE